MTDCPFCQLIASGDVTEANAHAVALADGYPVAAVRARRAVAQQSAPGGPDSGDGSRRNRAILRTCGATPIAEGCSLTR